MAYVIGVDTGGTYTDTVLLDTVNGHTIRVIRKAKAFTTHGELEVGIQNSIKELNLCDKEILKLDKVVLSTTLATNAIVEGNIHRMGLILIGGLPSGELATNLYRVVRGTVNIKGRILVKIEEEQVRTAVRELLPDVDSFAVSGISSVRNPVLEQETRDIIRDMCDKPVVCGYELASDLGFLERTNTAVINAGLLPIIRGFTGAIRTVLEQFGITVPVFIVKGDGSIAKIDSIRDTPVDTVLSGPASSIIGAISLTGAENAVVADMGGTTTDIGIVRNKRVELSSDGAKVGEWKLRIKSAKLHTFALGGDSNIKYEDGKYYVGPERVIPSCRGGQNTITPTDLLHYEGRFVFWNCSRSKETIEEMAKFNQMESQNMVNEMMRAVTRKIIDNISLYWSLKLPICAIGAPAKSWYEIVSDEYGFDLVIPQHYEVANAVGAATAGIYEKVEAVVRPGEEGFGYLAHTKQGRRAFDYREDAVKYAMEASRDYVARLISSQNLEIDDIKCICEDIYSDGSQILHLERQLDGNKIDGYTDNSEMKYLSTHITVTGSGKIFS